MLAVIAKLNVKAGCEADFEKAMLALAAQVQANEPGNHLYRLCNCLLYTSDAADE